MSEPHAATALRLLTVMTCLRDQRLDHRAQWERLKIQERAENPPGAAG